MSVSKHEFNAIIRDADRGGAFVEIPFDVEQVFGRKRVPVLATIDGVAYRGSLVRMGHDCHVLGVLREIRDRIGKSIGDEVRITLVEDTAPRTVDVPPDLAAALRDSAAAREAFERLSYTHQREYVQWVLEAKRDQTRVSRIEKTVQMLEQGRTR